MRAIKHFQLTPEGIMALDEDGYLWLGHIGPNWLYNPDVDDSGRIEVDWIPFQELPEHGPGVDQRSWLDQLEDTLRRDAKLREELRERFDALPPMET